MAICAIGAIRPGCRSALALVGVDLVGAVGVGFEILNQNVVGGRTQDEGTAAGPFDRIKRVRARSFHPVEKAQGGEVGLLALWASGKKGETALAVPFPKSVVVPFPIAVGSRRRRRK